MADTKSLKYLQPKRMRGDGGAIVLNDRVAIASNPVNTDTASFVLPAGIELSFLRFKVPDMDASTGLAGKIGYAALDPNSSLAASDAYFRADGALGQAAAVIDCDFVPIKFDEDVKIQITWTVTASGAFTAGTVYMTAIGNEVGAK
jgi:hypothetical protein